MKMPTLTSTTPTSPARTNRFLLWLLAASAVAHGLFLLLPVAEISPPPSLPGIELILLPQAADVAVDEITPDQVQVVEASEPAATVEHSTVPESEALERHDESPDKAPVVAAETLTRQSLVAARTIARQLEPEPDAGWFHTVPTLPDRPGWLNDHVGTVQAHTDRWRGSDGGTHTRTILASGQIICTSTRPMTTQEGFNPWMAAIVPMARTCGSERPTPVDRHDPWLRAPTSTGVGSTGQD